MSDTVLYEKDSHVVTIAYNRPERMNAINGQMREELNAAWLRFRDDEDAWVAILTGTGRAFCAGAQQERLPEHTGKNRRSTPLKAGSSFSSRPLRRSTVHALAMR